MLVLINQFLVHVISQCMTIGRIVSPPGLLIIDLTDTLERAYCKETNLMEAMTKLSLLSTTLAKNLSKVRLKEEDIVIVCEITRDY